MTESRLQKCIVTVYCVLMMFVLGASEALRGVFLPVFRDSFSLSQSQSSAIIMCSYIGMLLERRGMLLLCGSGLAFSILWPTIVLLIGRYYDPGLRHCHSDSASFHASAVPELLPAPDPGAKIQGNFVEIAQIEVPYSLDTGHFLQTYIICD